MIYLWVFFSSQHLSVVLLSSSLVCQRYCYFPHLYAEHVLKCFASCTICVRCSGIQINFSLTEHQCWYVFNLTVYFVYDGHVCHVKSALGMFWVTGGSDGWQNNFGNVLYRELMLQHMITAHIHLSSAAFRIVHLSSLIFSQLLFMSVFIPVTAVLLDCVWHAFSLSGTIIFTCGLTNGCPDDCHLTDVLCHVNVLSIFKWLPPIANRTDLFSRKSCFLRVLNWLPFFNHRLRLCLVHGMDISTCILYYATQYGGRNV